MNQLEFLKSVNLPLWRTFTFYLLTYTGPNLTLKSTVSIPWNLWETTLRWSSEMWLSFAQEGQLQVTSLQMCTSLYDIQMSHLLSQALHVLFYPIPNQHPILQCVELTMLWCILKQLNVDSMAFLKQGGWGVCLAATAFNSCPGM